jgi:Type I phosphodiesterase / nucleotide pyrophosphatase
MNPSFRKPAYGSHCFADLPQSIEHLLTGRGQSALAPEMLGPFAKQHETVILFFIDAFGWRFTQQYQSHPTLTHLTTQGHIAQTTSQFPSTTAAHTTTIHTGLPVGQSGVFEWNYYEPQVDALIAPLLFSYSGTIERDTLKQSGIAPANFYPPSTFYERLAAQGIQSTIFQHRDYTPSVFSDAVFRGAKVRPYRTFTEALVNLRGQLAKQSGANYYFLYFDPIDTIGHWHGPNTPQFEAEVDTFLTVLARQFLQPLTGQLADTLLMITADHGQVEIDPKTTTYLNQDKAFDGLTRFIKTNRKGELLAMGGSARDMFLYIHDDLLDEAQAFLAQRLADRADVVKVSDLIAQGYFGPLPLSETFRSRVSNLVILPYAGESVWWYEKGKYEQYFKGHHGGLTPQEMETPLILYGF